MLARIIYSLQQSTMNLEKYIYIFLNRRFPPDCYCIAEVESFENKDLMRNEDGPKRSSVEDILKEAFLWAVPKHRRTVEKRMNRKFGWPEHVWKPIVPKKNLVMCKSCGDHHEAGYLCQTCYSKIKQETEEMQKTIEAELGLKPNDKEVIVLYEGEKEDVPSEYFQGKRIVEMKKERPQWFSKNLLEKTTQVPSTSTSVKPTDLG